MKKIEYITDNLYKLEKFVRDHDYTGYDPYDALNSKFLNSFKNTFIKLIVTQLFVYSPLNLRPFFNIKPDKNPKAIGLFLSSYCKLYRIGFISKLEFDIITSKLVQYLEKKNNREYSGYCWGFNFNWQDITRFSKKWLPTIVITTYVGNSFLDLYEILKEKRYLNIANSISKFILEDLNITETKNGICFSYTPIDKHVVHNANCLGAAFLSRVYSFNKKKELLDYSKKAFDFSLNFQKENGSWAYGFKSKKQKERNQIDFHQGFIIDSLIDFIKYTKINNVKYIQSLENGSKFYMTRQFDDCGRSKWRYNLRFPIDIHHQAQGIITLCKLYEIFEEEKYKNTARKILNWTVKNMQDETGYFFYQKWPFITNKINYMRWSQAWMILALSSFLLITKGEYSNEKNN